MRILTGKMAARRRANRKWIALALVTVVLLSVMTWIGGNSLAEQNAQNLAQQQLLEEKIAEEEARSKELDEYSEYMKTDEFAEWYAKEKLGLIHKNEIIFKGEQTIIYGQMLGAVENPHYIYRSVERAAFCFCQLRIIHAT